MTNTEIKKFTLNRGINYLADGGCLLASYTYWREAENKRQIPWVDAKLGQDFFTSKRLTYIDDLLSKEDFEDYLKFIKAVRRDAFGVFEEFFSEDSNEEILKLCYIYPYKNHNQFAYLPDILSTVRASSIDAYSLEDFRLDIYKGFIDFLNLADDEKEDMKILSEDDIYQLVETCDFIEVLGDNPYKDQEIMALLRALKSYEEIYKTLVPLMKKLEKIIKAHVNLIDYRIKRALDHMEKSDFNLASYALKEVGFEKFKPREGEAIRVSLRLVHYNAITIAFSNLRTKGPEVFIGLLVEDLMEKTDSSLDDLVFQRKLKALGDPTRFSIISLLKTRPYYLQELADTLHLTPATLSYHINQLQLDGFLNVEVDGKRSYYSLRPDAFRDLAAKINNFV